MHILHTLTNLILFYKNRLDSTNTDQPIISFSYGLSYDRNHAGSQSPWFSTKLSTNA